MQVKLISITDPLLSDNNGKKLTPEELIVYTARVSNPQNQLNTETAPKLINYCIKHQHWSIFEMVDFTVEIKTSRAIAAQILRHKTANFQELSQRYMEVQNFEPIEWRKQGKTNRQVGDDEFVLSGNLQASVDFHIRKAQDLYNKLLKEGVARECARFILPLNTQTTLYMKNNIRNWIHYLNVRCGQDTQKEHRLIAESIKNNVFIPNFPNISTALGWKQGRDL